MNGTGFALPQPSPRVAFDPSPKRQRGVFRAARARETGVGERVVRAAGSDLARAGQPVACAPGSDCCSDDCGPGRICRAKADLNGAGSFATALAYNSPVIASLP